MGKDHTKVTKCMSEADLQWACFDTHSQYAEADPRLAIPTRYMTADDRLSVSITISLTYIAAVVLTKPAPIPLIVLIAE